MSADHPRRRADLVLGEMNQGAETILLDEATGHVVSLNATAAAVWLLCDGQRDVEAIAAEIHRVHPEADPAAIRADVRRILDELGKMKLLHG